MVQESPGLALRARGPLAIFTRPEFKVERVSYPVMTPSAARGLLEAVLWKPAIAWRVTAIKVLAPISFVNIRRNEVYARAPCPSAQQVSEGGPPPVLYAEDVRAQRNSVALRDVDYVVEAVFRLTEQAGAGDNAAKFVDMFERRISKGQHFHQPYLGCREFAADVCEASGDERPIDDTRDLGLVLWDIAYANTGNRALFFPARLEAGVLRVPPHPVGGEEGPR